MPQTPPPPLRSRRAPLQSRRTPLHSRRDEAPAAGPPLDSAGPEQSRSGLRAVLLPVTIAVTVGAIFIGVYLSAFHAPVARDLPVAVVGGPRDAAALREHLEESPAGTFRVRTAPDARSARHAVERGEVFGALIPGRDGDRLLYAGAHGPSVTALILDELGHSRQGGGETEAVDVVPPSPRDTRGLAVFYTTFGLVLAGYLYGIMTYQLAPRLLIRRRLTALAAFGVIGGLTVAAVVSAFGVLPAPFAGVAALVALVALAVGASTMLLVRALGVLGSSAAAVLFMTVGNATSGGSLPPEFLPVWLEPFSSLLPVGVGVRAVNGVAYFHGEGVVGAAAILAVWTGAGIGGLFLMERIRTRRAGAKKTGHHPAPPSPDHHPGNSRDAPST